MKAKQPDWHIKDVLYTVKCRTSQHTNLDYNVSHFRIVNKELEVFVPVRLVRLVLHWTRLCVAADCHACIHVHCWVLLVPCLSSYISIIYKTVKHTDHWLLWQSTSHSTIYSSVSLGNIKPQQTCRSLTRRRHFSSGLWPKPIGLVQRSAATWRCGLHSSPRALVTTVVSRVVLRRVRNCRSYYYYYYKIISICNFFVLWL